MAAFASAVALGYRYLETDVQATADGVVVAFHDDRLDRVTDRRGRLAGLPWSQVRAARIGGREPIPTLEELLGSFPHARVNIDAKSDAVVPPLIDVIRRAGAPERVCLAAFSDSRVARMRAALPGVCTALGPRQVASLLAGSFGLPLGRRQRSASEGACAQVPPHSGPLPLVTERFVAAAHRRGIQVHVWTIDDPTEMRRLLDLGVDGIMTDRPSVLRDFLTQRGQWVGRS